MIPGAPILAIILPLIGGFLTPLINILGNRWGHPRVRDYFVLGVSVGALLLVVSMAASVWGGEVLIYQLAGRAPPWGINLAVDGFNLLAALIVSGMSVLVIIYSLVFMNRKSGLGKYYTLLLLVTAGMLGVALTGDIFNLYVFFEIMSISSYALVAFTRSKFSIEASIKYLIVGTLGTAFILLGVALLYGLTGTLNIADLAGSIAAINASAGGTPLIVMVALGLFVTGFGIKIAMVPLHAWLPDAYQGASAPVATIMAGGTAVIGVYAMIRVTYLLFGALAVGSLFVGLGLVTMIVGALMALMQRDLKRLLAYSGISQMGYILLGIGLGTALGIEGGLFHMLNNAIYKALLFMCAGAVILRVGTSNMDKLGGLAEKMPITTVFFGIGALAISGVPPFNGFASKWTIYVAGVEAGQPIFTVIAVIISALTLAYFLKAFSSVFLGQRPKRFDKVREVPVVMLFPMCLLAVLCIVLGILPSLGMNVVEPARNGLLSQLHYIQSILGGV